jgi:topoisomerase-4 subunit A
MARTQRKTAAATPVDDTPRSPQEIAVPMVEAIEERYLAYALSTIMARSLPDVRDGLKPVHRRILWAMRELRLTASQQPKKSARVVGDVIGKFHPHGDQAVYETLVRMAQPFTMRYPLVDGQGNFGNIDGDGAAAMRYTESRLTEIAERLMEGIEDGGVDFRPTYDGVEREPEVMPAAFPNLLANGTTGIAVGMATSVPPHNLGELCKALLLLLKEGPRLRQKPRDLTDRLLTHIRGPDFPTGGVLVEPGPSMREAYRTGRGSFRLRARWAVEDLGRGQWQAVVSEIPYGVQKSRLMEQIAALLEEKKLPEIEDVRDESDEQVRLVVVPRAKTIDAAMMMERLFRLSQLEIRFPFNLNVLGPDRSPRVMGLQDALQAFLDHRRDVMLRRARRRIERIADRLEIVEGLRIAYANLDAVIRIIRESDEPKPELQKRFRMSDRQAEHVLEMRLRWLRRLDELALAEERKTLLVEKADLERLLADEAVQDERLASQIQAFAAEGAKNQALWARRTDVADAPSIDLATSEEAVPAEPITVVCSRAGWIRAARGHLPDASSLAFKEGDGPAFVIHAQSTDKMMVLASDGRAYALPAQRLPTAKGAGEPIRHLLEILPGTDVVEILPYRPGQMFLLLSQNGFGFRIRSDNLLASKKAGRVVMPLAEGDRVRALMPIPEGADMVAMTTSRGRLLCFALEEIPELEKARGVILDRAPWIDLLLFRRQDGLTTTTIDGTSRPVPEWEAWIGHRAQVGMLPPKGFPKSLLFRPSSLLTQGA